MVRPCVRRSCGPTRGWLRAGPGAIGSAFLLSGGSLETLCARRPRGHTGLRCGNFADYRGRLPICDGILHPTAAATLGHVDVGSVFSFGSVLS